MGVVYYANYLVWFEVARTDWLRETGWTYREMEQDGVSLPVIEAHAEYRQPARYDDEIEIRTQGNAADARPHPVRLRGLAGRSGWAPGDRPHHPCRRGPERPAVPPAATGRAGSC